MKKLSQKNKVSLKNAEGIRPKYSKLLSNIGVAIDTAR
jgi:hypothetical protein